MAMPHLETPLLRGPFTVDDYYRMAELGLLDPELRTELLDGQVVEMSPIGGRHAACVDRLNMFFARRVPEGVTVSVQNPVIAGIRSAPQPDVALLSRPPAAALPGPADVLLLIEVADTTLFRDREIKIPLYARSGIRECWLVDLGGGTVTVFGEPGPDGYARTRVYRDDETLAPRDFPDLSIVASEILG